MKLSERLEAAVERLYEDGMDTRGIADLFRESAEMARGVESLRQEAASKQARIDELMLEFCPEEMAAEQMAEWKRHQVAETNWTQLTRNFPRKTK